MDPNINSFLEMLFRWIHVVAGIAWIGHLYFFNFVNSQVAKTYDADSKKKVVPELMPRALYWFRWGAAYTWITGILLLGLVYYMGGIMFSPGETPMNVGDGARIGISVGTLVVGFVVYDVLWKAMEKKETVGVAISFVLLAGVTFGLSQVFSGRALFIHIGGLFGTLMAANVWMRIWPAQRKIISATKAGTAPDAAIALTAGLRSKQNTYMSVPLVLMMISNHYTKIYGSPLAWVYALVFVAVGWGACKLMFNKAAGSAPKEFEPSGGAAAAAAPKA